ncbi:ATP-dependent Clp protease proteolytic subunit [Desulfuromonas acetoxidans]|uniref:SDH family Clp fold serine proteinase n=1 Tax=Desulfuromonas acetoxidans TaxID=891 RepID=UPI00292F1873|nr:ATP-dependent Clp protease proteolytic subunit [Desulfuromonas acetoxidans]
MTKKKEQEEPEEKTAPEENQEEIKTKTYNLRNTSELIELFQENDDDLFINTSISNHLRNLAKIHKVDDYKIAFLYDDNSSISRYHSNQIYEGVSDSDEKSDIFLVIHSGGGQIEPAYLISKTCQRLKKETFVVAIPRRAKSAATLISLGADEIHMGLMSELGPIDPQIGGYPALGLSNALNTLADLACRFPDSADMFAKYLTDNLNIKDLGYFERVSESASQYAERLLEGKKFKQPQTAQNLADHFVNHYKDHGFVIDVDEAKSLLGSSVIKQDSKEYNFANEVYTFFDFVDFLYNFFKKKEFSFVGNIASGLRTKDLKK